MYNIYVGNMSFDTTEDTLRSLFAEHGTVSRVNLVTDRETSRPRGFGFVEMDDSAQGQAAIAALNGKDVDGRTLTVNEAKPKEQRSGAGARRW
jgi:cold-inducible RNA-binding protein